MALPPNGAAQKKRRISRTESGRDPAVVPSLNLFRQPYLCLGSSHPIRMTYARYRGVSAALQAREPLKYSNGEMETPRCEGRKRRKRRRRSNRRDPVDQKAVLWFVGETKRPRIQTHSNKFTQTSNHPRGWRTALTYSFLRLRQARALSARPSARPSVRPSVHPAGQKKNNNASRIVRSLFQPTHSALAWPY